MQNEHKPIIDQVLERRDELELTLEDETITPWTRSDIESAIATVDTMLTGDLEHLSEPVKRDLTLWLERNKYLGLRADRAAS